MPKGYMGKQTKWARDEKQAVSFICSNRPNKEGFCITKKGARLQIIKINEIH